MIPVKGAAGSGQTPQRRPLSVEKNWLRKKGDADECLVPSRNPRQQAFRRIFDCPPSHRLTHKFPGRGKHLIEIDPPNYLANYNLGVLDTMEEKWDAGEGHLLAAIRIQPASAEAHNMLGSLHMRRGDLGPAAAEFAEAIRVDPQFAAAHYNLGIIFRRQQKAQQAAQEFQKVLSIDPSFQPARAALDRLQSAPALK